MGVQSVPTLLPLADFARNCGMHPLHFQQVNLLGTSGTPNLQRFSCDGPIFQHEWQASDRVGRDEIARALSHAEAEIASLIGYDLLPTWQVDEQQLVPRPARPELVNFTGFNSRGFRNTIQLNRAWFIEGGIRATSSVSLGAAIVYSDGDGDGYKETSTVTVATTVTDPQEIAVFYPGQNADPRYEVRPIAVSIAAGVAYITFRRELVVLEALLESFTPGPVDGADNTMFLASVDVYRVYNDPSQQGTFYWQPSSRSSSSFPSASNCNCGSACTACTFTTQAGGCLSAQDARLSIVEFAAAEWDADDAAYRPRRWSACRQPDQMGVSYRAGLRDKSSRRPFLDMSNDWAQVVSILASAYLDRPVCSCGAPWFARWQVDLAARQGAEEMELYGISSNDLDNPIGTRRGMVYAWKRILKFGSSVAQGAVVAR